jgi:hypothetical protein
MDTEGVTVFVTFSAMGFEVTLLVSPQESWLIMAQVTTSPSIKSVDVNEFDLLIMEVP